MIKTHELNSFSHFLFKHLCDILVRKGLMQKLD